ncbi:NAD(P)/FAD-dependent oxidoreductase [Defluviimonas sp. WL0075]|uniref:NAD(P)/FAD-dependent oxidoreductase n=1 Tax=Albidovulum sediminicola TaxID=2984331 RepID=A0ABT2YXQ8_9RHOB|nr:NAD(P)/FAD-dependent oxidoreductase [Defluviimonas sp. WL0075]MCV2863605.1 NAD(P)/FAD-dependent oxidoreductase [Defluviimonas sp. WL0075]
MRLTRRTVMAAGAGAAGLLAAPAVFGQGRPHVVVIGGGAGGASVARGLALASAGAIEVTLVEANPRYTTCFFSNLYLGGLRPIESLQFSYDGLTAAGVTVIHDLATGIDRGARTVALAGGAVLGYDRLVLAPGIDFVEGAVPGWTLDQADVMPHAYKAGPQTDLLRRMVEAMPEGGLFVMVAPPNPYRCPPAPYERACMIAHLLTQTNPTAKIMILDPKDRYSKQTLFENGWLKHYGGMIEWVNPEFGGADVEVRPETMEVLIEGEAQPVDVCNVIPAQKAGRIAEIAGVTDDSGWAPIRPDSLRSAIDPMVWVLGDAAQAAEMPKSAVAAHSQAGVVVASLLGELTGASVPPPLFVNTCWSALAPGDSIKLGGAYAPGYDRITQTGSFISRPDETEDERRLTYEEAFAWYDTLTAEIFG